MRDPIRAAIEMQAIRNSYRRIFQTPDGEVVLKHLMKAGCVSRPVASRDPEITRMNAGKQELVLGIMKMVNADDSEIQAYIEENLQNV